MNVVLNVPDVNMATGFSDSEQINDNNYDYKNAYVIQIHMFLITILIFIRGFI